MALKRSSPIRGSRSTVSSIPFVLSKFERTLRKALNYEGYDERECGTPGSTTPDYTGSSSRALKSHLFSKLLSKYDPGTGGESQKAAALGKFRDAEEKCFWTNWKFAQPSDLIDKLQPRLVIARKLIHGLLGQEPPLEEIARGFGFGPGASTRLPRLKGDAVYKYSTEVEITPNALSLGQAAILAKPVWKHDFPLCEKGLPQLTTVWGNRVTTIPKNYKTDRVIAVEPCMNMYLQKGYGEYLKRRLKKVGIDLTDQSRNQRGCQDYSCATIDFSMASDLVSQGLASYLLPPNHADLIASMRSELGVMEDTGEIFRYNKVSSMGNGFTFELESLFFWALACSVLPPDQYDRVMVYGDDVILPSEAAAPFMELASWCGFIPNLDKSFVDGPFRESCGMHVHLGHDITPFYIKEPITCLSSLFLLHNNLWRWLQRAMGLLTGLEYEAIRKLLRSLRNLAPAKWRKPAIPNGYGDDAFIGSFAECEPNTCEKGWEAFECQIFALVPDSDQDFIEVPDGGAWVKSDLILR